MSKNATAGSTTPCELVTTALLFIGEIATVDHVKPDDDAGIRWCTRRVSADGRFVLWASDGRLRTESELVIDENGMAHAARDDAWPYLGFVSGEPFPTVLKKRTLYQMKAVPLIVGRVSIGRPEMDEFRLLAIYPCGSVHGRVTEDGVELLAELNDGRMFFFDTALEHALAVDRLA